MTFFKKTISFFLTTILILAISSCGKPIPTTTSTEENSEEALQSTTESSAVPTELSEDLYSFQFKLERVLYELPCSLEHFTEEGWVMDKDETVSDIMPEDWELGVEFSKGGNSIYLEFYNDTVNSLPYTECPVISINIDHYLVNEKVPSFVLPKDIDMNSTYEEIVEAYGEPTKVDEYSYSKNISYIAESFYHEITFQTDGSTGAIKGIDITNYPYPEDDTVFSPDEIPAADSSVNYTPPTELGDTWENGNLSLDGDLYHLPAPVSVFLENGWAFNGNTGYTKLASGDYDSNITIRKGNTILKVGISNYSSKQSPYINCYVISLKMDRSSTLKPDLLLPGNISPNSTEADVIAALGEARDSSESTSTVYAYYGQYPDTLTFNYDLDTRSIQGIDVTHQARSLDE